MNQEYIQNTLQAYVDTIIPQTPGLAEVYGYIQYYGALDLQVDEFLLENLEQQYIPLAEGAAELLNAAATQWLVDQGLDIQGSLGTLPPQDRLGAIMLSQLGQVDTEQLPAEQWRDPSFASSITSSLLLYTLMGYYSEWSGYGTTRWNPPGDRILEYFPISWQQIDYPGPSLGYRVLRTVNIS